MIGPRLRELRTAEGLSLRALAEQTGLSPTLLSQVERGVVEPSLKTLRSLSAHFGTSVATLFEETSPAPVHVSRPGSRSRISSPPGQIQYERLTPGNGQLEVLHGTLEPGESSSEACWAHDAIECAYVLTGILTVEVGEDTHEVPADAAVSFDSNRPHRYLNRGDQTVRFILSVTPPTP
ncbi:MAG TPA: cupin domain-containing protein [Nocardioides sp.]|nr:cupin domain-containing protein [Nocardioides sp.]